MSRKPTIDDTDDIDDEDGTAMEEADAETDLTLHETDDPGLGGGDEGYLNEGRDDDEPDPLEEDSPRV
jgi:hypothetical protein